MILELSNYIDLETVEEIKNNVRPFLTKNKHHAYNRDGYTLNITKTKELTELDAKIAGILRNLQQNVIRQRYKPRNSSGSSDFEYHLYEPGDICRCHTDGEFNFGENRNSLVRYASVVLHLNTVKEGGELVFPNQNKSIKTESGKVVVFPPYGMYEHYTTPSTESREVIVTWFVYNDINAVLHNGS
jgi:hypothetical protein